MRVQIDDGETFTTDEIRDANPGDLDVSAALGRLEAGEDVVDVNLGAGGITIFRRVLPPLELVPCDDITPEPPPRERLRCTRRGPGRAHHRRNDLR